jgi:TonB-linked SusC/RagA family outer membrane protein
MIMQLYYILTGKFRFIVMLLPVWLLSHYAEAQDITEKKVRSISVEIVVTDDQGKAIPKAQIVVGEGQIHTETDENGKNVFTASPEDFVTITARGYDRKAVVVGDLLSEPDVVLKSAKLFMSSDDDVALPFGTFKKRHLTNGSNVLRASQLEKYPSTDIRNAFTGLASGLNVRENQGGPGLSAEEELGMFRVDQKINVSSRGRGMVYIIDEIPTDITEMPLDPNEIESVTIVKDIVGKSLFGPAGAEGIIFIKTKRGRINERILNVNMETGINQVDRFPEWVDGADYARLNNMARINSGLEPLYSDSDIAAYAKNDPYDMYHPSINFRDMMLKDNAHITRMNVSSTGGNDFVQYYAYLGYAGEGDIYKIGAPADYNRLNARSNIDVKINDFIKVQFDFFGGLTFRRSPNYGWNTNFTSEGTNNPTLDITEFGTVINNITRIPPIEFPVYANNDPSLKYPWYAVSTRFRENPIGNLVKNGYYTESGRTGAFNVALDYDMSEILNGLKSRTYIGFNAFNLLRIGKAENYTAYIVTPGQTTAGNDTIRLTKVYDGVDQAAQANLHDFYYQRFAVYETLSYDKSFGKSDLQTSFTYYLSKVSRNGIEEPERQQSGGLNALYSYDDKYSIHGVLNYAGSSSFSEENRYILSHAIGGSWVISEENFLSGVKFLDYLKLRAETGVLGYESFLAPFYYRDRWNHNMTGTVFGPISTNTWFGTTTDNQVYRTVPSRTGNPDIGWEKRREFNAGLDALMFDRKLYLEVNYYNQLRDGQISQLRSAIPLAAGISSWLPRSNFNQTRYFGVETALQYTNNDGKFKYSFGGNAVIQDSRIEKYDEPNYRNAYQSRVGTPIDAIIGLTYLGRFATDAETKLIPQLYDAELMAGDLKYLDLNNDGVVDDNDRSMIGRSAPRLYYALNVKLNYNNFELYLMGTGNAFYDQTLTNRYFQNGWGDDTYSKYVLDNVGKDYPRLTYHRVNNNFAFSDFWMTKGGFFKIQNAELAYNVPVKSFQWSGVRGFRIFARGANLFTFSKLKDVDPESVSSGIGTSSINDNDRGLYPLFKTFTGGIKLTF